MIKTVLRFHLFDLAIDTLFRKLQENLSSTPPPPQLPSTILGKAELYYDNEYHVWCADEYEIHDGLKVVVDIWHCDPMYPTWVSSNEIERIWDSLLGEVEEEEDEQ